MDYKILTKVFSLRLSSVLPKLIHHDQKGFIKGRSIYENLLDIQALMTMCDNMDSETMLILLDIEKAFDSIGWDFIKSVLIQYQLPDSFIRWFEIFYTDKELRILNNGCMSEAISPKRGVAQGCGISPLFFILALEVLTLAIRDNQNIEGIMINDTCKNIR